MQKSRELIKILQSSSVELNDGLYGPPPTDEDLDAMARDYEAQMAMRTVA